MESRNPPLPHHNSVTRTANRWETRNSSSPGPIKLSSQSETRSPEIRSEMFLLHCSKAPPGVLKDVHLLQGQSSLAVDSLDLTVAPHPRFPVLVRIPTSAGGDVGSGGQE